MPVADDVPPEFDHQSGCFLIHFAPLAPVAFPVKFIGIAPFAPLDGSSIKRQEPLMPHL